MARHFNGAYSVRAGYHGPRKQQSSAFWTCSRGHINQKTRIIDERDKGGFAFSEQVRKCERCGESRKNSQHRDAAGQAMKE